MKYKKIHIIKLMIMKNKVFYLKLIILILIILNGVSFHIFYDKEEIVDLCYYEDDTNYVLVEKNVISNSFISYLYKDDNDNYISEIYDYIDIVNLILKILCIIEYEGDSVTFSMKKFVEQCANLIKPTPETIDGVMLRRQYTNSFTNITPGLYITTIHQSKGKEFDYVIVADVSQLNEDKNLLYVSHSRMKERLYPISVTYNGSRYGGR